MGALGAGDDRGVQARGVVSADQGHGELREDHVQHGLVARPLADELGGSGRPCRLADEPDGLDTGAELRGDELVEGAETRCRVGMPPVGVGEVESRIGSDRGAQGLELDGADRDENRLLTSHAFLDEGHESRQALVDAPVHERRVP